MRNQDLAKDYISRAGGRLRALDVLYEDGHWADVVREAQEVVELALKAALRSHGVDPPRLAGTVAFSADPGILNCAHGAFARMLGGLIALAQLVQRLRLEVPLPGLRSPREQEKQPCGEVRRCDRESQQPVSRTHFLSSFLSV